MITNIEWIPKYPGCFFSCDDCYSNLHNNVIYKDCTLSNYINSLSRHKSCVWDFNISSWANVQVGVDAAGEVILSVYVKPKNGKKYNKTRPYECLPIYRLTYESLDGEEERAKKVKGKRTINYLIDSDKPIKNTFEEMIDSYGLIFNEIDLVCLFIEFIEFTLIINFYLLFFFQKIKESLFKSAFK